MNLMQLVLASALTLLAFSANAASDDCGSLWQDVPVERLAVETLTDEYRNQNVQSSFTVTSPKLSSFEIWDHVMFHIRSWLETVKAIDREEQSLLREIFDGKPLSRSMQLQTETNGKFIIFRRSQELSPVGRPQQTAVLFQHPDRRANSFWRIHITLRFDDQNQLRMNLAVLNWSHDAKSVSRAGGAPRLLKELLNDPKLVLLSGQMKLRTEPVTVDESNVDELLASMSDEQRVLPIVLVLHNREKTYGIDVDLLARELAGRAVVYAEGTERLRKFVNLPPARGGEREIFIVRSTSAAPVIRSINLKKLLDLSDSKQVQRIQQSVSLITQPEIDQEVDRWGSHIWSIE